jgi:hypothetical protein
MRFRLALFASALVAASGVTGVAQAASGDRAISDPLPGEFRLNPYTLEPGCFSPRYVPSNIDLSSFDMDVVANEELRVANRSGDDLFSYNIDQILVPAHGNGYRVYDTFNRHGADIAPGEQEGEMFAPGDGAIENDDVILCVSDELAPQNEPYAQEDGGLVSAKNRPVIVPKVTGIGASALEPLNTYKIAFGYDVPTWYEAPTFDGFGAFPAVTDPESFLDDDDGIPTFVRMKVRLDDLPYDARRVNDVDFPIEGFHGGDENSGQSIVFHRDGDDTAWLEDDNGEKLAGLITSVTQGDFPVSWSLRPSLANPDAFQEVEFTLADLHAWEQDWQDYYDCEGPLPAMPLAPGSNPPASDDAEDCNAPPAPAAPAAPAAPVVNNNNTTTTNNTTVVNRCVSSRQVSLRLAKNAQRGTVRVAGNTIRARRSDGRLRAMVDLRGMEGSQGAYVRATVRQKVNGKWQRSTRLLKLC